MPAAETGQLSAVETRQMLKSQMVRLALNRQKCTEMDPEWSPGPENRPPGMPRPFPSLWDHSRGPKSTKSAKSGVFGVSGLGLVSPAGGIGQAPSRSAMCKVVHSRTSWPLSAGKKTVTEFAPCSCCHDLRPPVLGLPCVHSIMIWPTPPA